MFGIKIIIGGINNKQSLDVFSNNWTTSTTIRLKLQIKWKEIISDLLQFGEERRRRRKISDVQCVFHGFRTANWLDCCLEIHVHTSTKQSIYLSMAAQEYTRYVAFVTRSIHRSIQKPFTRSLIKFTCKKTREREGERDIWMKATGKIRNETKETKAKNIILVGIKTNLFIS